MLVKKHAKKAFERLAVARRQKHIAGRGDDKRFNNMWKWARLNLRGPIVYAFWRGSNCLYVGKGAGPYRLGNYQRSVYIRDADLLEVWRIKTRTNIPRAECLAIHLYEPRDNQVKAARVKWGKACPVCKLHDKIRDEVRSLFRMRA